MPVFESEYKELLGIEKWDQLFKSDNKEKIQEEMYNLQDAIKELKSEVINDKEGRTIPKNKR